MAVKSFFSKVKPQEDDVYRTQVDFVAGITFGLTFSLWVCTWAEFKQIVSIPYYSSPSAYFNRTVFIDVTLFSEFYRDNLGSEGQKAWDGIVFGCLTPATIITAFIFFWELCKINSNDYKEIQNENKKSICSKRLNCSIIKENIEVILLVLKIILLAASQIVWVAKLRNQVYTPSDLTTYEGTFHAAQFIVILVCVLDAFLAYRRGLKVDEGYFSKPVSTTEISGNNL